MLLKGKFLEKDLSNMLIDLGREDLNELKRKIDTDNFRDLKGNVEKAVLEVISDFEANKDPRSVFPRKVSAK